MPAGHKQTRKVVAYGPHAARVRMAAWGDAHGFRVVTWHELEAGPLSHRPNLRSAVVDLTAQNACGLLVDARSSLGEPAARIALEALLGARNGVGRGFLVLYAEPDVVDDVATAAVRAGVEDAAHLLRQRVPRRNIGERRYGWKRVRGERVPDAYQQAVLGRMAELRSEGLGPKPIAQRLRELGYRGPDGKAILWPWVWSQLCIAEGRRKRPAKPTAIKS